MRYVSILDPADQWLVYDTVVEVPAEVEGRLLMGLSKSDADRLAAAANTATGIEKWRHWEAELA